MNSKPFFTVGIPVYNTEKWVGECIESILSQNFSDFEIICVDDGSTDNSLAILNSYTEKDSRIKVITRANGGPATARNAVLHTAEGEYLFFIDSDDIMNADTLSTAFSHISLNNFPHLVETGVIVNSLGNETIHHPRIPPEGFLDSFQSKDERFLFLLDSGFFLPAVFRKFISVEFIKANGLSFNQRYIIAEDYDFSCRLYRKLDTVSYLDFSAITYFHPREGSITSIPSAKAYYTALCQESEMYSDMKYWDLSINAKEIAHKRFINFVMEQQRYCIDFLLENDDKSLIVERAAIVERFIAPHIKKTHLPLDRYGLVYILYRIFGIKRTIEILCIFFKK